MGRIKINNNNKRALVNSNIFKGEESWFSNEGITPSDGLFPEMHGIPNQPSQTCLFDDNTDMHDYFLATRQQLIIENKLLRKQKEELEQSNHAKDLFLATLSHELKTPLTSILCWTHVLKCKIDPDDKLEKAIHAIEQNTLIQDKLLNDLLDISSIALGKVKLNLERVNIVELIENVIALYPTEIEKKQISISLISKQPQAYLKIDMIRMQQVLNNLINNAVKFIADQVKIEITVEVDDHDVVIYVRDNGNGISPEILPHIFERFSQGNAVALTRNRSFGLGLSLVHDFIHLQGGVINVSNADDEKGATFIISFPRLDFDDFF